MKLTPTAVTEVISLRPTMQSCRSVHIDIEGVDYATSAMVEPECEYRHPVALFAKSTLVGVYAEDHDELTRALMALAREAITEHLAVTR